MNTDNIKKYAQLVEQKRKVQAMLKDLEKSIATHREAILADYAEAGLQSCKVDVDGHKANVFVRKQIWANAKDGDIKAAVEALESNGVGFLVEKKFNTHSLSSWVREQLDMIIGEDLEEKIHRGLPAGIADHLSITEKIDLGVNLS